MKQPEYYNHSLNHKSDNNHFKIEFLLLMNV